MILKGKRVRLDQLAAEAIAAGLTLPNGLAQFGDLLTAPTNDGGHTDVPDGMQSIVDAHTPMRDVTDEELNIMFAEADAAGDHGRMIDVLAQAIGQKPRQKIPE